MGFPARLLGDGESVVLQLRPHVKRLLVPVLVLLAVAPVTSFVVAVIPAGQAQGWVRLAVVAAGLLVVVRWTLVPFAVWWNTLYVVTDRRLVMRQGVLSRSGHDMPLTRLNDVSFSHNLLERMLGCGTLVVESAGERGQVVLTDVPKVEQVQRTLYRLSDAVRGQFDAPDGGPAGGPDPGRGDAWRAAATAPLPQDGDPGRDRRWWGRR